MIEFTALPATVQAVLLVCFVTLEAVVLYAGYGVIERVIGPSVVETIETV